MKNRGMILSKRDGQVESRETVKTPINQESVETSEKDTSSVKTESMETNNKVRSRFLESRKILDKSSLLRL